MRVDAELARLDVDACFSAPVPSALMTRHERAHTYLQRIRWEDGAPVPMRDGRPDLREARTACIHYSVDLARANRQSDRRRRAHAADSVIVDASAWLWRPQGKASSNRLTLRFDLPEQMSYSVPWVALPESPHTYDVGHTPFYWPTRTAFGQFVRSDVDVPGAQLRLALVADPDRAEELTQWIRSNAMAVATLYGQFPLASPQILVTATRRASQSAVPWGQVLRGGHPSVLLVVDATHDLDAFLEDWTASHELSHLLLPFISRREAWLGEGFASYYQNVLRARAGMLSERQAWQKLHEGFGRGLAGTRGKPLSEATRRMHNDRAYMRVYWSGVAIVLLADVGIRQQSNQEHSLDTALEAIRNCCLPSDRVWRASHLAAAIDENTGTRVFGDLVDQYAHAEHFPAVQALYPKLGIVIDDGRVELDDNAPLAHLRRAITTQHVAPD